MYEMNLSDDPFVEFMGTRETMPDGSMGDYKWMARAAVDLKVKGLARGLMQGDFCPEVDGEEDGPKMRFVGIWAKNRWEWAATLIACMYYNIKVVGFFDAMGADALDFILNQTELSTIVCTSAYVKRIVQMKKDS